MRIEGTSDPVIVNLVKAIKGNTLWPSYIQEELSEEIRKAAFINDRPKMKETIAYLKTNTGNTEILEAARKLEKKIEQ